MTDIQAFGIGRFRGYGSALALAALVLGGCTSSKPAINSMPHSTKVLEVHMEYHKKMLAEQKKHNSKTLDK